MLLVPRLWTTQISKLQRHLCLTILLPVRQLYTTVKISARTTTGKEVHHRRQTLIVIRFLRYHHLLSCPRIVPNL